MTACILSQINRKTLNLSEKSPPSKCGYSRKKKKKNMLFCGYAKNNTRWDERQRGKVPLWRSARWSEVQDQFRHNGTINLTMDPLWRRSDTIMPKTGKGQSTHRCSQPDSPITIMLFVLLSHFLFLIFFVNRDGWRDYLKLFPFFLNNCFRLIFGWNCRVSR